MNKPNLPPDRPYRPSRFADFWGPACLVAGILLMLTWACLPCRVKVAGPSVEPDELVLIRWALKARDTGVLTQGHVEELMKLRGWNCCFEPEICPGGFCIPCNRCGIPPLTGAGDTEEADPNSAEATP